MSQYDVRKIEELQMILMKDPRSPVFAGLAEAYRTMGLLEEALEVTTRGVRHNPEYVSGLVAHSRILFELKDYRQAIQFLNKAHLLKPENILALRLLAHCFIRLKQHKEALRAFKKLLIAKPNDEPAIEFIQKWEFLDNLWPGIKNNRFELEGYDHWIKQLPSEKHVLHLIDSFLNSGDRENALEIANMAMIYWTDSNAIKQRQQLLLQSDGDEESIEQDVDHGQENQQSPALDYLAFKKRFYNKWLQRIENIKGIDQF